MTSHDFYEKTGFKCGLEIHIQLNTERKLFCSCPNRRSAELPIMHGNGVSGMSESKIPYKITRKIRPSAGELGKMDPAALHEFLRGRSFSYAINRETACLVETDDEPPHEINREALEISLSVAKAFGCAIPDEIIVMRKVVADGSAVSGFQRTALAGINGTLETESGVVRIANLSLEEDSATTIGKENGVEYRLDRLGVPLIEIGTEPDIKNPEHARQVAEKIGMLLFEKRLRGIGSIRQDLNVSIKGGARVEIKGVQDLDSIAQIIENEIKRQQSLIEIKNELENRKANQIEVGGAYFQRNGEPKNIAKLSKDVISNIVQKTINEGGSVFAGALKGFAGLLKKDCGGKTFGKELSSYAGVFGLGIIHSDETEKFPFLAEDFAALRKELSAGANDLIFIVAGKGAEKASKAVMQRAVQAMKGVPEETRAANPDGTTSYLRPLPGAGRMYPETDVPPIKIAMEFLGKIKPPKSADEKLRELEKILPKQMAGQMLRSEYFGLFEKLTAESKKYDPTIVANILLSVMKDLKRKGIPVENISETDVEKVFSMEKNKAITKDSIPDMLEAASKGIPMEETARKSGRIADGELRNIIRNVFLKNPHLARDKKISALMGEIMKEVRGRAEGEKIMKTLKEELDKYFK